MKRGAFLRSVAMASRTTKLMIVIGFAITSVVAILILFGSALAPYDPNQFVDKPLLPPSSIHFMGTDVLGRDVFSRIVCGTGTSISIGVLAIAISATAGTALGSMSGFLGGIIDKALSFTMDSVWILPTIVVALLIILVLGGGLVNTALAIAIVNIPRFYRVIRSHTLAVKERGFIEAQKMVGAKWYYIIIHHIAPFYVSSLASLVSLGLAQAVLAVAGLGFLGLGVPPPTPEWGTDLASGRQFILTGEWWLTVFPGMMIFVSVFGFNLLSEGLATALRSVRLSKL